MNTKTIRTLTLTLLVLMMGAIGLEYANSYNRSTPVCKQYERHWNAKEGKMVGTTNYLNSADVYCPAKDVYLSYTLLIHEGDLDVSDSLISAVKDDKLLDYCISSFYRNKWSLTHHYFWSNGNWAFGFLVGPRDC